MEEGREPHHINVGVGLAPAAQLFFYIRLRLGLAHIVGQLVGRILPVVGQEVVHVYRIPDQERQKADGVLVVGDGFNSTSPVGSSKNHLSVGTASRSCGR